MTAALGLLTSQLAKPLSRNEGGTIIDYLPVWHTRLDVLLDTP
jgi:hypothetical protein